MLLLLYQKNESRPSPSTKLTCKDSAKGRQYKIKVQKTFIFIVKMQPILSKDSAKNRFSEGKENIFSFLSVRFLSKSKTIQNKSPKKSFSMNFYCITREL